MQLLWLICQLTAVTAMPASVSHATVRKLFDRTINAELRPEYDYREDREKRICETAHCNEIARKILESRDATADPCENFYQYACGSWAKHNPIPDNEVEWSEDQVIMEKTYKRIKDVLEEQDKPTDIPPVKLARKFYRSCMNTDAIEKRGIKPIQDILDATGGWPIAMPIKEWNSTKVPWQKIDKYYIRLIGNSAFYNIEYEVDQNNTNQYILSIDQDTQYPLANKIDVTKIVNVNDTYATGIYRIAQAFAKEKGYILNRRQLVSDVAKVVYFKLQLLQIIVTGKESHATSNNYVRLTIKELQKWYNSSGVRASTAKINFLEVLQYVFKLANITINETEPIMLYNPEFLHKLARLLGNTSQRVLVNYVQWNMIDKFLSYTTQEMRDIQFNISYSSYNVSNYMPRWQLCVLNMKMQHAVSYMYVKKYISDDVIHKTKEMVQKIKEELKQRIMQAQWVPKSVEESLTRKLDSIETLIGYPSWYKDDQAVTNFYKELRITSDYFQNVLNCEENELIKGLKELFTPVVRTEWLDYPITVNAFYSQTVNAILIPAAEVQDPYFTLHLPDAINYGGIGFVIGHELSHSFDNEGMQFDVDGYKSAWITQEVLYEYEERLTCLVKQYNKYTLNARDEHGKRVNLDGDLTEDENLADSVGVQIAFSAYKKVAKEKAQTKLPGLENVSDDELFFLAFANSWCAAVRPEYEEDVANNDEHSPANYRIIGSLSNMAAFSETFNCSRNSPMNPRKKCNLWN